MRVLPRGPLEDTMIYNEAEINPRQFGLLCIYRTISLIKHRGAAA